jgi:uncharacterized RDD family membrane protein YckC
MVPFYLLSLAASGFGVLAFLAAIGATGYFAFQIGETGQSPGMRVAGVRCIHQHTGHTIGGGLGIVRLLASYLNSLIFGIGWLLPLWDPQRQTLSDKVMTTVVVHVPKQRFSLTPIR